MGITRVEFGTAGGKPVHAYDITGPRGISARVLSYGAMLASLKAPDAAGKLADITLGFADIDGYLADPIKVGALCGRVVNRIRKGRFSIRGREYQLALNNGANHIHGGPQGFDRQHWQARVDEAANAVTFTRLSPDGEEGYPGNLTASVTYTITPDGELALAMQAHTDATTIVNMANHAYWNLAGHDSGSVLGHRLMIDAERYTPLDGELLPTGEMAEVAGTPFDFRKSRRISENMPQAGYDINFWLNERGGQMHLACRLEHAESGRALELLTDQPGLQIYTGALLNPSMLGRDGKPYQPFGGIALETQKFADAPNHPNFPSIKLEPGEVYRHNSLFRFLTI